MELNQETYDLIKKSLDEYKAVIGKELDEIREEKEKICKLKSEIYEYMNQGQYIRDDKRIIISAPEILIGDLNQAGELQNTGTSKVIIRSKDINLQGVGDWMNEGTITNMATSIKNISADPGIDGREAAVEANSSFTVQARNITVQSNNDRKYFSAPCHPQGGIHLNSDSEIVVKAAVPFKDREMHAEAIKNDLTNEFDKNQDKIDKAIANVNKYIEQIKSLTEEQNKLKNEDNTIKVNYKEYDYLNEYIRTVAKALVSAYEDCTKQIARQAEIKRRADATHKNLYKARDNQQKFKNNNSNAAVKIIAENTSIVSSDDDGVLRFGDGAGVNIHANQLNFDAGNEFGVLHKESKVKLHAEDINLSTTNEMKLGNNDQSANWQNQGKVHVISKDIMLESIERTIDKEGVKESELTEEGNIKLRAKNLDVSTYGTDGKSGGKFVLNSQDISIKSTNVDTENKTDQELDMNGSLKLHSGSLALGTSIDIDKGACQKVEVIGEEIGIYGRQLVEIQQDAGKAIIQLENENIAIGSNKNSISGDITIDGKANFKQETTHDDTTTIKELIVKRKYTGPVSTEGT